MPYSSEWYVEKKVLLQRVYGAVTLEDVSGLAHDALPYFRETGGQTHHIILDLSDITRYPTRLADLRAAAYVPTNPNLGWMIFVSKNRLIVFLASTMTQTVHPHLRSRWFGTVEEAVVFLEGKIGAIPRHQPSYRLSASAAKDGTE